ncbi:hypothetical protein Goari_008862 [Gossypium aridum]|uniref:Uncharacterized protein n=2 Tax=Gossypium TaxID=3633 RepID=A0A7J8XVB9_GOSAI|nr:hypothetical protein [Gossypium aridum]
MPPHASYNRATKKRAKTDGASSSAVYPSSVSDCFRGHDDLNKFKTSFATRNVHISRPIDLPFLRDELDFRHLPTLNEWGWLYCLQLTGPCHDNLVRVFYFNAEFKYGDDGKTVTAITSYVMGEKVTITPAILSQYLRIPLDGDPTFLGSFPSTLILKDDHASDLELHDRILHLILTWTINPTNKHAILRKTDYWFIHCFQTKHHLNLPVLMFLNMIEVVRWPLSSNKTLKYGTFLSFIFRQLKLKVSVDPGRAINSFIDISSVHSCGYCKEDGKWVHKDKLQAAAAQQSQGEVQPEEEVLALPPPPSPRTSAILDAIHGLSQHVDARFDALMPRIFYLEDQMAQLVSRFPPPPSSDD